MPVLKVKSWIETNLWAILDAGVTLWSGYLTGQMTTETKLHDLERRVTTTERQLQGRKPFMVCAVRTLDRINDKVQAAVPCTMDVPE